MSFYVLSLVLGAAVLHAFWNLLSKKAKGKAPFIWLMYIASTVLYLPILLYQIVHGEHINDLQPVLWFSLSSAILHIGYFLVLQKGYRSGDLSVVYPLAPWHRATVFLCCRYPVFAGVIEVECIPRITIHSYRGIRHYRAEF